MKLSDIDNLKRALTLAEEYLDEENESENYELVLDQEQLWKNKASWQKKNKTANKSVWYLQDNKSKKIKHVKKIIKKLLIERGILGLDLISAQAWRDTQTNSKIIPAAASPGDRTSKKRVNYRKRKCSFSDTWQRSEYFETGVLHGISRRNFHFFIIPGRVPNPRVDFGEMFGPRRRRRPEAYLGTPQIESKRV